jgi:hypothetical protein
VFSEFSENSCPQLYLEVFSIKKLSKNKRTTKVKKKKKTNEKYLCQLYLRQGINTEHVERIPKIKHQKPNYLINGLMK